MVGVREPVDAGPFDFFEGAEPGTGGAAALCLHGLTGTPYEVRPLGEAIARRGIRARGPLLPGHNSTPESLVTVSHQMWQDAVRAEFRRLRERHDQVFVVGLSLGGVLSLDLALGEPVDGLVLVGVPLRFRQPIPLLVPLLKHVYPMLSKLQGSDIRSAEARSRHPGYRSMPLAAVHELIRLQRRIHGRLGEVDAPTLVAHGAHDRTASPSDARVLHDALAAERKHLLMLADSAHVVPVDHDGPELAAATADFLASLVAARA